jgi:hypothetical protein
VMDEDEDEQYLAPLPEVPNETGRKILVQHDELLCQH